MADRIRRGAARRWAVIPSLTLLTILLVAASSTAHPPEPYRPLPTPNSAYSVTLEDESGRTLRTFNRHGQTFVLGHYGDRYNIRVSNHTGRRVEAVVSVDGRDVISGSIGDYAGQRGYIIKPWGSTVIRGFRRSLDRVAAFRFTDPGDSYSSRRGTPENVGVIGAAFFPERRTRHRPSAYASPRRPYDAKADAGRSGNKNPRSGRVKRKKKKPSSAPRSAQRAESSRAPAPDDYYDYDYEAGQRNNLGTRYGESRHSRAREVPFRRASSRHPARVVTLRYDDAEGLAARGIDVYPHRHAYWPPPQRPDPFPHNTRFAPPPR